MRQQRRGTRTPARTSAKPPSDGLWLLDACPWKLCSRFAAQLHVVADGTIAASVAVVLVLFSAVVVYNRRLSTFERLPDAWRCRVHL